MMNWSPQQEQAIAEVRRWMKSNKQVFKLFGFAGSGKTTLVKHLVLDSGRWLFASLTGKAAQVMRRKGCPDAMTIHSIIYRPAGDRRSDDAVILSHQIEQLLGEPQSESRDREVARLNKMLEKLNQKREVTWRLKMDSRLSDRDVEGIIIDEVSMVDRRIAQDLESFGKKVLVVGDPAQLPPVGDAGYYTKQKADVLLTEVHRQASESAILRLATAVREADGRNGLDARAVCREFVGDESCRVLRVGDLERDELNQLAMSADQVLCGRNATRRSWNLRMRELAGLGPAILVEGDRLICLRNRHDEGLLNGSQWICRRARLDLDDMQALIKVESEDSPGQTVETLAWLHHMMGRERELEGMGFNRRDSAEFTFGYVVTTHKAQGSQWPNVLVMDESRSFGAEGKRWLYTAITRSSEKLVVVL